MKKNCPEFDFNHEALGYFLFPQNKESYDFKTSLGETESFIKELFDFNEEHVVEDFLFGGENCDYYLKTIYFSDNLDLEIENNFIGDFNSIEVRKEGEELLDVHFDWSDLNDSGYFDYLESGVEGLFLESLEINEQIYDDVLSFNFNDNSSAIYIAKGKGLVRLVLDDEVYDIE